MKPAAVVRRNFFAAALLAALLGSSAPVQADPSRYPEFAQQSVPENVTLSFISIDELVDDLKAGKKPLIVDVRSSEEYREVHILGALSAPLAEFRSYVKSISRDRPVVLY